MKRIDLISCVYNEEAVLPLFLQKVKSVLVTIPQYDFHLIIVNDGSKDQSLEVLRKAQEETPELEIIDLSRNFGHEAALNAGLQASGADAVIVLDADLEDPPELIPELIKAWEDGAEVVNAKRISRKEDRFLKRLTAKGFYRLINRLSGAIIIPENVGNFRLISQKVLKLLNELPEKNRVFRVLIPFLGFETRELCYERHKRPAGYTHYNWSSMMRLAIDGITSATIIPLKIAINTGFVVSGLGFAYMIFIIFQALFSKSTVEGWASTMSVILFLGGIQLIFLGVLGEYLGRIFMEVKGRPNHLVKNHFKAKA